MLIPLLVFNVFCSLFFRRGRRLLPHRRLPLLRFPNVFHQSLVDVDRLRGMHVRDLVHPREPLVPHAFRDLNLPHEEGVPSTLDRHDVALLQRVVDHVAARRADLRDLVGVGPEGESPAVSSRGVLDRGASIGGGAGGEVGGEEGGDERGEGGAVGGGEGHLDPDALVHLVGGLLTGKVAALGARADLLEGPCARNVGCRGGARLGLEDNTTHITKAIATATNNKRPLELIISLLTG